MTHLSALMIITLNLTITQLKSLAKYLMTLVNKKGFRYSTVIFVVWKKNKSLLHDILSTVKTTPDIIAISASKINENTSANLKIPGYAFVNTNSRSDLDISDDGIESCWIELPRTAQKNIVITLCSLRKVNPVTYSRN